MQRQLDNLSCSLTRLSRPLHPGMKQAYDQLRTHHAEPNGTHRPAADAGRRCSARGHGGECRVAFETKIGNTRIYKDVQSFDYYSGCILISRSSKKKLEKPHVYNSRSYLISS